MEAKGEDGIPSDTTAEDEIIRSCKKGDSKGVSDSHPAWYYVEVDRGKQWRFEQDNGKPSARNPEFYGHVVKRGQGEHPSEDVNEDKSSWARDKTMKDLTPLHVTVLHGDVEFAEKLLNNGADPSIRDKSGYSPVELAASKGDMRMIQLFQQKSLLKDRRRLKQIAAHNEQKNLIKYLEEEDLIESAQRFLNGDVQAFRQNFLSKVQEQSPEVECRAEIIANIENKIRSFDSKVAQWLTQLEQEEKCNLEEVRQNLSEAVTDGLTLVIGSSTEEQHDMEHRLTPDIEETFS